MGAPSSLGHVLQTTDNARWVNPDFFVEFVYQGAESRFAREAKAIHQGHVKLVEACERAQVTMLVHGEDGRITRTHRINHPTRKLWVPDWAAVLYDAAPPTNNLAAGALWWARTHPQERDATMTLWRLEGPSVVSRFLTAVHMTEIERCAALARPRRTR